MKKIKKVWVIGVLVFVMAFTMTACGGSNGGDEGSTTTAEKEMPFATSEMNGDLTMGEIDDGVYTNESFGLKIDLGSDWEDTTQKSRDTLIEYIDSITEETFESDEAFREQTSYGLPLVRLEKSPSQIEIKVRDGGMDIKESLDSTYKTVKEVYGDDYEFSEPATLEIAGTEWYGFTYTIDIGDASAVVASYMHNYGDYIADLSLSINDMYGDDFDDVIKQIKPL